MSTAPEHDSSTSWLEPDAWHRPCAYWFWHGIPTEAEIVDQVGQMHTAGIHSFQIQARMSLPLGDYLSLPYLAAYRRAVDEAARRGMLVGIYDDYSWQSGHAAGRAVEGHDQLRERHLFWTRATAVAGDTRLEIDEISSSSVILGDAGMAWHFEGSAPSWTEWEVVRAVATNLATGELEDVTHLVTVAEGREDGCTLSASLPPGVTSDLTVFAGARSATSRLINYMDRAAVERFVQAGYDPIVEALGEHVGTTARYVFFDQPHPNYYSWRQQHGQLASSMPYSHDFLDHLEDEWGDRLGTVLMTLLDGDSVEARAQRSGFYEVYSRWSMETFLGTIRDWCHGHGLLLSGHEVLPHVGGWDLSTAFSAWDLRVNFGLDFFGIDSYRDLTGCDAQDSQPQLSAKMADSVARSHGRSGAMLEQYYGAAKAGTGFYTGHWGLTASELRAQTIRHHLLGMRQLIEHGFYQTDGHDGDVSMFANPRFDFPPGFNYEPWFSGYHGDFALESGRLSQFLDDMAPTCEVAVLYPLRTIWADTQNSPHAAELGTWCERLSAEGYGYHLVDESDLLSADAVDGGLRLGDREYRALVLPHVTTVLSQETTAHIGRLAEAGCIVVATGTLPSVYQEGEQTAAADWSALTASPQVTAAPSVTSLDLTGLFGAAGRGAIEIGTRGGRAWTVRGTSTAGDPRAVVFNDGADPVVLEVAVPDGLTPVAWSPDHGGKHRLAPGSALTHVLEPMGLLLLDLAETPSTVTLPLAPSARVGHDSSMTLTDGWEVRLESAVGDGSWHLAPADVTRGLEHQGFDRFSGVSTYTRSLRLTDPRPLLLTLPAVMGSVAVRVNGVVIGRRGWEPFEFELPAASLVSGENTLAVEVTGTAANGYYAGTGLRLDPEEVGLLAAPVLSWTEQGHSAGVTGRRRSR